MNVPLRFHDKFVSNYKGNKREVDLAVNAITNRKSVFLYGSCGTGKSHLAVALAMEWLRAGNFIVELAYGYQHVIRGTEKSIDKPYLYLPHFLPSVELFLELKATFDSKTETEMDVIDKYSRCPLLIIDDVGAEKVSDWSRQIFYTLIDRRYRDMKQTIITTNKTPDQIAQLIDERITSRIFEMGEVIELKGNDRRIE